MKQYSSVVCVIEQMDNLDILTESTGYIQVIPNGVGDVMEWVKNI